MSVKENLRKLLRKVDFANSKILKIESKNIHDDEIEVITNFTFANTINELNLSKNKVSGRGMKLLSNSLMIKNLLKLDLSYNELVCKDLKRLVPDEKVIIYNLTDLILKNNKIACTGLNSLTSNKYFSNLRKLDLSYNELEDNGVYILKLNQDNLHCLRNLNIGSNQITILGVQYLCASKLLTNLTNLNLSNNKNIKGEGITKLANAQGCRKLEYLNLKNCEIDDLGFDCLLESDNFQNLKCLDVGENKIKLRSLKKLAALELNQLESLIHLSLSLNNINNNEVNKICESKLIHQLEYLNLSLNNIGNKGVDTFINSLKNNRILKINLLSNMEITDKKKKELGNADIFIFK